MARQPRYILPGYPQHVIQRGNNRDVIFADVGDYRFYLNKLAEGCSRHGCRVHAYVLMTNHVHLLKRKARRIGCRITLRGRGRPWKSEK